MPKTCRDGMVHNYLNCLKVTVRVNRKVTHRRVRQLRDVIGQIQQVMGSNSRDPPINSNTDYLCPQPNSSNASPRHPLLLHLWQPELIYRPRSDENWVISGYPQGLQLGNYYCISCLIFICMLFPLLVNWLLTCLVCYLLVICYRDACTLFYRAFSQDSNLSM